MSLFDTPTESVGLYGNTVTYGGTYFEWFIFQESATAPATPTGGSWNFLTNTGTAPSGWTTVPPATPTNIVWASIAIVNSRNSLPLVWSTPASWVRAGTAGAAATIAAGTTTTGAPGTSASVTNSGTSSAAVFNFTIPRGDVGATGANGTSATVTTGTTTTGSAGSSASVTNSGTVNDAVFNFTIPRGDTGATGPTGATGATGATGTAATIAAGTTTTTAPGTSATVTNVGTSSAAVFDFGIPRGAGVITGGSTGQFLAKASSTDYDTTWLSITGGLSYLGTWNASTNTPTLTSGSGTTSAYYVVSVAGSTNLDGITDWQVGDWAIFNGTAWQKIDQTNTVTSVNGQTGTVVLTAADVSALSNVTSTDGSVTVTTPSTGVRDLSVATAASTTNVLCQIRNTTGATLTKGTVVYISGATGQIPTVSKALATSDATSAQTLGMLTADLANNSNGYVTVIGLITNIDTSAYADGDQLYLSGTTAGAVTATKQYAPVHLVYVGVVEYAHPTQGKIFVKVQNGYELDELHNVSAQTPTTGQTIVYNSSTGLWEQNTVSLTSGVNGTLPVANGGTGVTTSTGSGNNVLSTSPTLVTPILGTPTSATLTNATGLPLSTGVTGTLPVANGGTNSSSASISSFNNITGYTASGATGTTSTNLVFSTNPTITNPTVTNYVETPYSANSSTAITLSLANGTVQIITLTGSATITMPTAVSGKSFIMFLKQDATGSRTVTWSTVVWPGGTAPTITSTASKQDIYSFFSDGTNWYGVTVGQSY